MFCSKCGKPLSDGAMFCSHCGAKVEKETVAVPTGSYVIDKPSYEDAQPVKQARPTSPMTFDWSNVIDESHKKTVPANLKSPWDSTGIDEESVSTTERVMESAKKVRYSDDDLFAELEKPSTDSSRTMSFIDMLRAEREEKEKRAAEAAMAVTEKEELAFDYSAFDEKADLRYTQILPDDEREYTRGYTDLGSNVIEEIKKAEETPASTELDEYIRLRQEARRETVAQPEEPQRFVAPAEEEQKNIEAAYEEKTNDLSAELAAILGSGIGFASSEDIEEEASVDLFGDVDGLGGRFALEDEDDDDIDVSEMLNIYGGDDDDDDKDVEDEYDDDDEFEVVIDDEEEETPAEPEVAPVERAPKDDISSIIAGILGEEAVAPAPVVVEEPADTDISDIAGILGVVEEPVAEEPVAEEPVAADPVQSEIEMLKARLAELMGDSLEEPEAIAKEDAPSIEELIAEPVAEPADEDDIFSVELDNIADDVEPQKVEEPVVAIEEVVEEPEPAVTDEMSFEAEEALDLDSELASLGFVTEDDAEPVVETAAVEIPAVEVEPVEAPAAEVASVEEIIPTADMEIESLFAEAEAEPAPVEIETDAMSIEELERDLFGDESGLDGEAEATRKIDKFYTLYKKNEEFQRLLDEEYSKLQGVESSEDLDAFFEIGEEEKPVDPIEEFTAQQQPIGQMSMPAAAEVEARKFVETPAPASTSSGAVKAAEIPSAPVLDEDDDDEPKLSKKELKAQKKAAKKAAKAAAMDDEDDDDEGGNALTIIAVVIAMILVVLLAAILVMNFAPDTGIGMKLNMFVENLSSYFSAADAMNDDFLL